MALSRKKKIIIGVSALVVLVLVVVISVIATRRDEPEGAYALLHHDRAMILRPAVRWRDPNVNM